MRVGWLGLGKLGLPCALALAKYGGHDVLGYDVSEWPWRVLSGEADPPREEGIEQLISGNLMARAGTAEILVKSSDVVFVAVQTPHGPAYDGSVPAPDERRDFDYTWLAQACREVCAAATRQRKSITLAVVSTVLPGTCNRIIRPLLGQYVDLAYVPLFIAMGTTVADFLKPEFVLCGADDSSIADTIREVFKTMHGADLVWHCGVEDAELTKVIYNTAISVKIVLANTIMEICHKTGADCDTVAGGLALATDRVISPRYLRGGMGDGGHCHPRDLIAMSWLAQRLELSFDMMGDMAWAREAQTRWLAEMVRDYATHTGLPVVILGASYKAGSDLTAGSPALLLASYLEEMKLPRKDMFRQYDPYAPGFNRGPAVGKFAPSVFVIATAHDEFFRMDFPAGSVVVDPWGQLQDRPGVTVVRVGRK